MDSENDWLDLPSIQPPTEYNPRRDRVLFWYATAFIVVILFIAITMMLGIV